MTPTPSHCLPRPHTTVLLDEAVHDRYVRNIARYCQSQAQEREKLRDFLTRGAVE